MSGWLHVDPDGAARFAELLGHGAEDVAAGFAPPLYAVRALPLLAGALPAGVPPLHLEQEFHFAGRLRLGTRVRLRADLIEAGDVGSHRAVRVGIEVGDVVRMVATLVVGPAQGTGRISVPPRPALPRQVVAEAAAPLPAGLPAAYGEVSGDRNPVHLDAAAARQVGLPGVVVHGMATLGIAVGLATRGSELAGTPLTYLRGRMARPVLPGTELSTALSRTDSPSRYRLRARVGGVDVLRDVELRTAGAGR